MKVSDIDIYDLRLGDRVISATGKPGQISQIYIEGWRHDKASPDPERCMVSFKWNDGSTSLGCMYCLADRVQYIGR